MKTIKEMSRSEFKEHIIEQFSSLIDNLCEIQIEFDEDDTELKIVMLTEFVLVAYQKFKAIEA